MRGFVSFRSFQAVKSANKGDIPAPPPVVINNMVDREGNNMIDREGNNMTDRGPR